MERKRTNLPVLASNKAQLATMSALVARANLALKLGQQYGGDRDLYEALGYTDDLKYTDYYGRYIRQDIAKAIIDRPVRATWQGVVSIQENAEVEQTNLEAAWKELYKRLGLKTTFSRMDRLSGIGHYGALLLGLDDVAKVEDFEKPVASGTRKLMYAKPYGEDAIQIDKLEDDTTNPRYGLPLMYSIKMSEPSTNGSTVSSITIKVHYTRVIHIVDDILENEIVGSPRLEAVFNRLMDLEKIVGGDAEMFWRGARPGYQGEVDPDYQMTTETKADLKDQIDEFEHNLRRILVNEGVKYSALDQQIAEPSQHVDIQLQMISAVTGIPKRILTGTERGELSSNQDAAEWRSYVQSRREDHAEPNIVRPFVDRCIELKVLPVPQEDDYQVVWSDLYALSESDKVKIGLDRSAALKNYVSAPIAEAIVSPEAFLSFFLGLKDEEVEAIKQMDGEDIIEEMASIAEAMTPKPAPPTGAGSKPGKAAPTARKNRTQNGTK